MPVVHSVLSIVGGVHGRLLLGIYPAAPAVQAYIFARTFLYIFLLDLLHLLLSGSCCGFIFCCTLDRQSGVTVPGGLSIGQVEILGGTGGTPTHGTDRKIFLLPLCRF